MEFISREEYAIMKAAELARLQRANRNDQQNGLTGELI